MSQDLTREFHQYMFQLRTPGYCLTIGINDKTFAFVIFSTGFIPNYADSMPVIKHIIQRKPFPLVLGDERENFE
jgi:hypothetical protein